MAAHRVPSYETAWNEFVLQTRLKYVAFKRFVWLLEVFLLLMAILLLCATNFKPWLCWLVVVLQTWRVVTEAMNHQHLAHLHNVADRFAYLALPVVTFLA